MQSRENQRGNQEWTIQRKPKGKSRMDNPEILATLGIRHRMKTNKTKNTTKKTDTIEKPWVNLGTGKGKAVLASQLSEFTFKQRGIASNYSVLQQSKY